MVWRIWRFARKVASCTFITWEDDMSRHIADHRNQSDGGRLRAFYQIEKEGGQDAVHPTSRDLHKRPLARLGTRRVENYLRIERGITA